MAGRPRHRMLDALRSLRRASFTELKAIALGQLALLRAQRSLRSVPVGGLVDPGSADAVTSLELDDLRRARLIAQGVMRASRRGVFRPTCLVRAMAISQRLEAEGVKGAAVRVGVARQDGKFAAHAWVELCGEILGDDEAHVSGYQAIPVKLSDLR